MATMRDDVEERLAAVAQSYLAPGELTAPVSLLTERIGRRFGPSLEALLHYGSGRPLDPGGKAVVYAFIAVVTSSADAFPRSWLLRLASHVWTPELFVRGTEDACAKVVVILAADLKRGAGPRAAASRHVGRFRNRMWLLRARDEAVARLVARCQARALALQVHEVLATRPAGEGADALARRLIELADEGHRLEDRHVEFEKLADAPAFYREVARVVLAERPPRAPAAAR
ncbi:MAG: hypothetical protein HY906_07900 [Deltaproteobacteria bacterium]|nr:hypothetical protein [Deltaproteobacteria bacterium]